MKRARIPSFALAALSVSTIAGCSPSAGPPPPVPPTTFEYPTDASGHVATVTFAWIDILDPPPGLMAPWSQYGFFNLAPAQGFGGGWIQVNVTGPSMPPAQPMSMPPEPMSAPGSTAWISFPVLIDDTHLLKSVPKAVRDKIAVTTKVIARPHWDTGNPVLNVGRTNGTVTYPLSDLDPTDSQHDGTVQVVSQAFWLDQDHVLEVDVHPDPSIVASGADETFTAQMPSPGKQAPTCQSTWDCATGQSCSALGACTGTPMPPFRTALGPYGQTRPAFLPIALIGQPPGNKSSSSLSDKYTVGFDATMTNDNGSSSSSSTSIGLGTFSVYNATETISRTADQGTEATFSFLSSSLFATGTSFGPGPGDSIVGLLSPPIDLYGAAQDADFRPRPDQEGPHYIGIPVRDLLAPPPGSDAEALSADDRAALLALDPLATDPHAPLPAPRFLFVAAYDLEGVTAMGSAGVTTITKSQVAQAIMQSSGMGTSVDLKLSAIFQAAGTAAKPPSFLPDPSVKTQENDTITVSYKAATTLSTEDDVVASFTIADTDPTKTIRTEVYYDTLFRTFLFRDATQ